MNATSIFSPRYLKADDLQGQTHLVHIERIQTREDVLDPQAQTEVTRHILHLYNGPKGFMLNKTQTVAVVDATGEDNTDNWPGKSLLIRPITNQVGMLTIEVLPYDPTDTTNYAQFSTRPARALPTGQDVQRARSSAYMPTEQPPYVGMRAITPPAARPAANPRGANRRQAAAAQAAAD